MFLLKLLTVDPGTGMIVFYIANTPGQLYVKGFILIFSEMSHSTLRQLIHEYFSLNNILVQGIPQKSSMLKETI